MVSVVVLQARTNSSRLPGKVLLPIKGLPLAVLAAKRAANTGRQVIVATSVEMSDDGLAATLDEHGVTSFRGDLENTLDRMVTALAEYEDDTIVFRLTADNVFPDGRLLDEIEAEFVKKGFDYLSCNGEPSGLPYGMSVEITRLVHLREALRESQNPYDWEHVTPYIIRKFGRKYFDKYAELKKGHFRCTVDCLDDYLVMQHVFSNVQDPVQEPYLSLVHRLEGAPFQPVVDRPVAKLVLGTAQLGSEYGIANKTGQPDRKTAEYLIKSAIANGVTYLDTARAYGSSEAVIGQALKGGWEGRATIISKLSPMVDCPADAETSVVRAFVDASVFESCSMLGIQKIGVLMLHRAAHLHDWGGVAWRRLLDLRSLGLIGDLGVSVQNPQELTQALSYPEVRFVQMPFNLLDWRWDAVIPELQKARVSRGVIVHVRSALLQGLLPSWDEALWQKAKVDSPSKVISWMEQQVTQCGRKSVVDLCFGYLNAQEWVDGVVTGMEQAAQLHENIALFNQPALTDEQARDINMTRPLLSEATLNPALWSK